MGWMEWTVPPKAVENSALERVKTLLMITPHYKNISRALPLHTIVPNSWRKLLKKVVFIIWK